MNAHNPQIQDLATRLADLTGESEDDAVVKALEQRLQRERERAERRAALREITAAFKAGAPPDLTSDHSFLYDEHGLPK